MPAMPASLSTGCGLSEFLPATIEWENETMTAGNPLLDKHKNESVQRKCFYWFGVMAVTLCCVLEVGASSRQDIERVLWPSDLTELRAQPDSCITPLADGSMDVKTGVKYSWPGVRMDFLAGECDLTSYGSVKVAVSNTTDKPLVVRLSVKGETLQGQMPGGLVSLMPHTSGELLVYLWNVPYALDAPLELNGMRGHPKMGEGSTFDVRRVRSFHIFRKKDGEASGFSVRRITVAGIGMKQKVLSARTFLPFVDRYGQFAHDDWPGKIHCDAGLAASRVVEEKWLKEHSCPIPDADRYGGWCGGPQLKATGFFRTEKVGGKWWLVDPEGHLFFSHGVDCVDVNEQTGVRFRERYFSWLPEKNDPVFGKFWGMRGDMAPHGFYKDSAHVPYDTFDFARANAVRKYGEDWKRVCAERAHERIRIWGLNTIANWSDSAISGLRRTPYTATFVTRGPKIEGLAGLCGRMRDPFAPQFVANARKMAAEEAKRSGDDPWCVGWFVDNELGWGKDNRELGRAVLRSPAKQPAKVVARAMLEKKYGDAGRLDAAWGTRYGTWEAFLASTNVPDEKLCGPDIEDLHRAVVRQYFSTVRDAIKSVAPNRLYLGARIAWGGNVIYEESARYCDVVSVNVYDYLPVRDLPPEAVDRPMVIGEFHFGAFDRGMFHRDIVFDIGTS